MRVGILGAGGPAGSNLARSLEEERHEVVGYDGNPWHLPLIQGERYLMPERPWGEEFLAWLQGEDDRHEFDVILPQPDPLVEWLARYREKFQAAIPLPDVQTIQLCQNKWEAGLQWRREGLHETPILKIEDDDGIREAGKELGYPYWLRASTGAGARGASEIVSEAQAFAWIEYWVERGVEWDFIAEEFLPGRDYAWTSLWWEGALVTSQARERLEYIFPHLAPSGRTGTPTVAVTVAIDTVNTMAQAAVLAADERPHGVYCVDLREDVRGAPRPTEINCGRFFTTSFFYTKAGLNIPALLVALATGRNFEMPPMFNPLPAGLAWVRHIDCGEHLVSAV